MKRRGKSTIYRFSEGVLLQMGPKTIIKLHFRAGKSTIKPFIQGRLGAATIWTFFPGKWLWRKVSTTRNVTQVDHVQFNSVLIKLPITYIRRESVHYFD